MSITKALSLPALDSLVIDEADLILSYGHDEDVRQIFSGGFLPKVYQSFLMSATMTEDVETLKGLALRNPVSSIYVCSTFCSLTTSQAILKLEEDEDEAAYLSQYSVRYVKHTLNGLNKFNSLKIGARKSTNSFSHMSSSSFD
jgi:ATP-dependent RNA helicase DDX56/DBP9